LSAAVAEEMRLMARCVRRTPAGIFCLAAAAAWPLLYMIQGNAGTTPLALAVSMAAIPIGPLLWTLFGARLTWVDKDLPRTWPASRSIRALGTALGLTLWTLLGTS
jgi:hypothetical protein